MTRQLRARVFRSGNSVALRLPKALGVKEGDEFDLVRDADGRVTASPVPAATIDLAALFGSFSSGFMDAGRLPDDTGARDWTAVGPQP